MMRISYALLVAVPALLAGLSVHAQVYPVKPIRLIVPYPPGGGNDLSGRMIAQKLAAAFRQQVIVDNRAGASGIVGAELGARAAPDGYTLLLAGAALMAMNPALLSRLSYDPIRDYAPVSLTGSTPFMLMIISNWFSIVVPAATLPAVIARLNTEIVKIVNLPDIRVRFAELGLDPLGSTPQEQLAFTRSEIAKWAKVVKAAGIPVE
jgi:tripartite-type tricarboxylate transporter receptor subunit TctC